MNSTGTEPLTASRRLSDTATSLYAETLEHLLAKEAAGLDDRRRGSFKRRRLAGHEYWYYQYRDLDQGVRHSSFGPVGGAWDRTANAGTKARSAGDLDRKSQAGLLRAAGYPAAPADAFRLLRALTDAGLFRAGATLIGTHSYPCAWRPGAGHALSRLSAGGAATGGSGRRERTSGQRAAASAVAAPCPGMCWPACRTLASCGLDIVEGHVVRIRKCHDAPVPVRAGIAVEMAELDTHLLASVQSVCVIIGAILANGMRCVTERGPGEQGMRNTVLQEHLAPVSSVELGAGRKLLSRKCKWIGIMCSRRLQNPCMNRFREPANAYTQAGRATDDRRE